MIVFEKAMNNAVEVNVLFDNKSERNNFLKKFDGYKVVFGKNNYAETATIYGNKQEIIKILTKMGYSKDEIVA